MRGGRSCEWEDFEMRNEGRKEAKELRIRVQSKIISSSGVWVPIGRICMKYAMGHGFFGE